MKVLHITTSSKGGAGIAAFRLHEALRAQGVESGYLSKDLTVSFEGHTVEDAFFMYQRPTLLQKIRRKLTRLLFPTKAQKLAAVLQKKKDQLTYELLSPPYSIYDLSKHPLVAEATLINLHWVSIVLDYPTFFQQLKKPMVWTLHDLNPFSGVFHYQYDAQRNAKIIGAIDEQVRVLKQQLFLQSSLGAVVGPSQWMTDRAQQSSVFPENIIYTTIANTIAVPFYKTSGLEDLRSVHGISRDEIVFLFIAHSLTSYRKGIDLLLEALKMVGHHAITLLTVGQGIIDFPSETIKIVPLGTVHDPNKMAACYAAADAFLLPSREDNLPNVMLESFAMGTPVLSFPAGGMLAHIKDDVTGYLAKDIRAEAFATVLMKFIEKREVFTKEVIMEYAKTHFEPRQQANEYMDVYKQLTENK